MNMRMNRCVSWKCSDICKKHVCDSKLEYFKNQVRTCQQSFYNTKFCAVHFTCWITNLTVPTNRTGSWGIMDSLDLRSSRPILLISTPSIVTDPPDNSIILNNAIPIDDLPKRNKILRYRQTSITGHSIEFFLSYDCNKSATIASLIKKLTKLG